MQGHRIVTPLSNAVQEKVYNACAAAAPHAEMVPGVPLELGQRLYR